MEKAICHAKCRMGKPCPGEKPGCKNPAAMPQQGGESPYSYRFMKAAGDMCRELSAGWRRAS